MSIDDTLNLHNPKAQKVYYVQKIERKKHKQNRSTDKNIFKRCKKEFLETLDVVHDIDHFKLIGDQTTFNLKFSDEKHRIKKSIKKWIKFTQKNKQMRDSKYDPNVNQSQEEESGFQKINIKRMYAFY